MWLTANGRPELSALNVCDSFKRFTRAGGQPNVRDGEWTEEPEMERSAAEASQR
jgi:hypothetical protein